MTNDVLLTHFVQQEQKTQVAIGPGVLKRLEQFLPPNTSKVFVIGDSIVMSLYGDEIKSHLSIETSLLSFAPGESSKVLDTWFELNQQLEQGAVDRRAVVIGLGGGVSTDLAGFIAATSLRGLDGIFVPTSLLGMVDAAIGGKVGLNSGFGKNRIGCMWWPKAVVVDPDVLLTLPDLETSQGLAEVIKIACVDDPPLLDLLLAQPSFRPSTEVIIRAIKAKLAIVERDPFEKGERAVLNFGHTVGHAIEACSNWSIPHGDAVALGMEIEASILERISGIKWRDKDKFVRVREKAELTRMLEHQPVTAWQDLLNYMASDKKSTGSEIRFSLPSCFGGGPGNWTVAVDLEVLETL
ncbi:MAG: 3-dehydroquinate synthase [Myxococcota bacterium]|jgi:3-dehydroquinate synthase|nr:3-dehydroquinate synthase [Myxococcota bacterium]OQC42379.1 MAG: 3-dehydroquinate synthase [Deltaproteobacteria bacterium ADurb.Bin058]HQL56489.1 3-dehydroquinate synthase family protein [Myxococcota bacterium]